MHTHSSCSDGELSPSQLLLLAKERGLSGLSITDHDTVRAYTPELFKQAKSLGLELFIGIEFSAHHLEESVHILGYSFSPDAPSILELCYKHANRRKERNLAILDLLQKGGMPIFEEDLKGSGTIGRPHIAKALVEKGFCVSVKEAFSKFLGDHKPYFVSGKTISVEETIGAIHRAGGKAFLAHPHLFHKRDFAKSLLDFPFDGIECFYARCSRHEEQIWLDLASEKKLQVSGGSDFHGSIKPHIPLGCSWINERL